MMSKKADKHLKLTLPQGCKEINEDLSNDELVKRLKLLTQAFHEMSNDENEEFKPLALYLASQHFLEHPSKDVRLLIACCIADILRVFVPEAPYTEPDQLKEIFMFLAEQLRGLKKPESPSFKRYFYLLETLAWVKSFNISLELPDNNEIIAALFNTAFDAIHPKHSPKVTIFMLDILCPLLTEADAIQQDVIDTFVTYLIEPYKSQNKPAFEMAKDLVKRTSSVLEPYIENFLNNCLLQSITGSKDKSMLSRRVYDVIYALYNITPSLLNGVLPQLEFKLKSNLDVDRMATCKLLARLFSSPNNALPQQHKSLWNAFLSRFNDIDLGIRRLVTQSMEEIIINNPEVLTDSSNTVFIDKLRHRQHDPDENVRMDVVKTIVGIAKADIKIVADELLECVKERSLDKKFKVRKEALVGLGQIYRKNNDDLEVLKRIGWVRNKIFHAYYQVSVEDKILVERILNSCLVPYTLDATQRMQQLFKLYSNMDEPATRVLEEIFRTQYCFKSVLKSVIDLLNQPNNTNTLNNKIIVISKHLPEPEKAAKELFKFFKLLQSDSKLKETLQSLIAPQCPCKKAEGLVKEIIKKLGSQTSQNLLYATVKQLLERVAPLMIDVQAISCLATHVEALSQSRTASDAEQGLSVEAGLKLLLMLAHLFSGCVYSEETYSCLLRFLNNSDPYIVEMGLQIMKHCGKQISSQQLSELVPLLEKMSTDGTPKQAKHAIRCIDALCEDKDEIFTRTFERLSVRLTGVNLLNWTIDENTDFKMNANDDSLLVTSIVAIGYLNELTGVKFSNATSTLVTKYIYPEIFIKDRETEDSGSEEWCEDSQVSPQIRIKLESLKMVVRWLLASKSVSSKVISILRLFYSMVLCEGDLMEAGLISKAGMSRLRLQAGKCLLLLAQEPLYAEKIKLAHFSTMALLINDPCLEVRKQFDCKLHKGLMSLRLPIQYMAILCLGALDPVKSRRAWVKQLLTANVNKRREFLKNNAASAASSNLFSIFPDYVLPYAIHLLSHDPDYSSYQDVNALESIKDCLTFLLDALITRTSTVPLSFYQRMLNNIKNTEDAQYPESTPQAEKDEANKKLYAICDLASLLISSRASHHHNDHNDNNDTGIEPVLPARLYRPLQDKGKNTKIYLPAAMVNNLKKNKKSTQQPSNKVKCVKKDGGEDEEGEEEEEAASLPSSPLSSSHSTSNDKKETRVKKGIKADKQADDSSTGASLKRSYNKSDDEDDGLVEDDEEEKDDSEQNGSVKNRSNKSKSNKSEEEEEEEKNEEEEEEEEEEKEEEEEEQELAIDEDEEDDDEDEKYEIVEKPQEKLVEKSVEKKTRKKDEKKAESKKSTPATRSTKKRSLPDKSPVNPSKKAKVSVSKTTKAAKESEKKKQQGKKTK